MAYRFVMEDVERLCSETGAPYQEAMALLLRAEGNYQRAVELYRLDHCIFIQPESVSEGRIPLRESIKDSCRQTGKYLRTCLEQLTRVLRRLPASVYLSALGLLIAPKLTAAALLLRGIGALIARRARTFETAF